MGNLNDNNNLEETKKTITKHLGKTGLCDITISDLDPKFFKVGDLYVLRVKCSVFRDDIICGICDDFYKVADESIHHASIRYLEKDEYDKFTENSFVIKPEDILSGEVSILDRINEDKYKEATI